jgi:hypothetical protein
MAEAGRPPHAAIPAKAGIDFALASSMRALQQSGYTLSRE